MAVEITIRLDFDAIKNIEGSFRTQETATQQTIGKLNKVVEQLRRRLDREGATAFYNEMDVKSFRP
jgi:uncharacterized protein YukE